MCWTVVYVLALVSPTDLSKACGMFAKLRLPIRLKTFKSGLIVVTDSSATDELVERNVVRYLQRVNRGVTPLEVGAQFKWSVGVAMELLQVTPPQPCRTQLVLFVKCSFVDMSVRLVLMVDGGGEGGVMSRCNN